MFPTSTTFDIADRDCSYVVLRCNLGVSARIVSDRNGFLFRQFVHTMIIAFILTILRNLVIHVDRLITEKQMTNVHAQRVVACVQNMLIRSDFAAENRPSNAVCALLNDPKLTGCKRTVAASMFESWSGPNPARLSYLDVIQKCRTNIVVNG